VGRSIEGEQTHHPRQRMDSPLWNLRLERMIILKKPFYDLLEVQDDSLVKILKTGGDRCNMNLYVEAYGNHQT